MQSVAFEKREGYTLTLICHWMPSPCGDAGWGPHQMPSRWWRHASWILQPLDMWAKLTSFLYKLPSCKYFAIGTENKLSCSPRSHRKKKGVKFKVFLESTRLSSSCQHSGSQRQPSVLECTRYPPGAITSGQVQGHRLQDQPHPCSPGRKPASVSSLNN